MKNIVLFFCCTLALNVARGQSLPKEYAILIKKADSLYNAKDYKNSALTYSAAFKANGWKGTLDNRYNAACSWAMAHVPDSAFFNLMRIATRSNYKDIGHIIVDTDLIPLHKDKRWQPLLDLVKQNKDKAEFNLNKPLAQELDTIYKYDQQYRQMIDEIQTKYGYNSKEIKAHWKIINENDSLNLIKVTAIIDKYGWVGADVVGDQGSLALFLVIQHADLKTQEKYLPMMKEAVKNEKASGANLALLVDRIEMRNGRPQIYGSQITMKDGKNIIYQIADEINVNKRRADVGLQPLEDYVRRWNIDYKLPSK